MRRAGGTGVAARSGRCRHAAVAGRWVTGLAVGVSILLSAGCARPAGVDGSLTDDWPPFPTPSVPVPVAGTCYHTDYDQIGVVLPPDLLTSPPCTSVHNIESVYVGTFSGADAQRDPPPQAGSSAALAAYARCGREANAYLGGDWRDGFIQVTYALPTAVQWRAGARFYQCDVVSVSGPGNYQREFDGTLRNALAGAGRWRYGCATMVHGGRPGQVTDLIPVTATRPTTASSPVTSVRT